MTGSPDVLFLRDTHHGGPADQAATVAAALAAFVDAATTSIDVAIYDFRLSDPQTAKTVVDAFTAAAARGVTVRIGYDAGKPETATAETFAALGGDPAPPGTPAWVTEHFGGTGVQIKAIEAGSQLMHSKYIIRDAGGSGAPAVWTGSTNFTDDAWTRQENNIIRLSGAEIAGAYHRDFDEMWTTGSIKNAGKGEAGTAGGVSWDFSPGDGVAINAALTDLVTGAKSRIVVATMVLTSHQLLDALATAIGKGVPVSGIYDGGQMDPIARQWAHSPHGGAVLADWKTVSAKLARKNSTPYSPTSVHDFMHLKVLITDGTLTTGSYNFSANAEKNAENQVHLDDPATVTAYADYVAGIVAAY